jgi:Rad3-related DNA helicase
VVCLDPRIVSKPYGKLFIESLPECRRVAASLNAPIPRERT